MQLPADIVRLLATARRLWFAGKLTFEQYARISQALIGMVARSRRRW